VLQRDTVSDARRAVIEDSFPDILGMFAFAGMDGNRNVSFLANANAPACGDAGNAVHRRPDRSRIPAIPVLWASFTVCTLSRIEAGR